MPDDDNANTDNGLDMVNLRADCLHGAIQILTVGETEVHDPRDALLLAEEFLAWVLGTPIKGSTDSTLVDRIDQLRRGTGEPPDLVN